MLPECPSLDVLPVLDRVLNLVRDTDAPGLRERSDARGDVYTVPVDSAVLEHHVAQVDSDPQP